MVEDNTREKHSMRPLTMKTKAISAGTGVLAGAAMHQAAAMIKRKFVKNKTLIHGKDLGVLAAFIAMVMPEDEWKYRVGGFGVGMAVHDVFYHVMHDIKMEPLYFGDQKEDFLRNYNNYYRLVHYDPTLPMEEKEAITLPLISHTVHDMRGRPEQVRAIRKILAWSGVRPSRKLTMDDVKRIQGFFFRYLSDYEGNEGLWHGHDRYRTAARLVGEIETTGRMPYDCDCASLVVGQIVDSFHYPFYVVYISQKTMPNPRKLQQPLYSFKKHILHPLHHVLPAVMFGGQLWLVECIKRVPIIPIRFAHKIFSNLRRMVIVDKFGWKTEYDGWKSVQNMEKKTGMGWNKRYPALARHVQRAHSMPPRGRN